MEPQWAGQQVLAHMQCTVPLQLQVAGTAAQEMCETVPPSPIKTHSATSQTPAAQTSTSTGSYGCRLCRFSISSGAMYTCGTVGRVNVHATRRGLVGTGAVCRVGCACVMEDRRCRSAGQQQPQQQQPAGQLPPTHRGAQVRLHARQLRPAPVLAELQHRTGTRGDVDG